MGKKSKINGDLWEDAGFSGVHGDRGNDHNGLTIKIIFQLHISNFIINKVEPLVLCLVYSGRCLFHVDSGCGFAARRYTVMMQ